MLRLAQPVAQTEKTTASYYFQRTGIRKRAPCVCSRAVFSLLLQVSAYILSCAFVV